MKKLVLAVAALAVASTAYANGPFTGVADVGIRNTKHDISANGSLAGTITQKCVFCHTPHNAQRNVPLWNRLDGQAMSAFYNSPKVGS